MFARIRRSLELRMVVLAGVGLLVTFVLFAALSLWANEDGVQRALVERQLLARSLADRVAHLLRDSLDVLEEASLGARCEAGSPVELVPGALHTAATRTQFSGGVYLLDSAGRLLQAQPPTAVTEGPWRSALVRQVVETGIPAVSDVWDNARGTRLVSLLIPVRDSRGKVEAVLGGDVECGGRRLDDAVRSLTLGETGYVQVIDGRGRVLAGREISPAVAERETGVMLAVVHTRQEALVSSCRFVEVAGGVAPVSQIVAWSPVPQSSWSVLLRQDADEALLPTTRLRRIILFIGLPVLLISVGMAWGTARSVVRPLALLGRAADQIAGGDLSNPVPSSSPDEIGRLAATFEVMRQRLYESMERIRGWNAELEARVAERTQQLEEHDKARHELLRKVITAQEQERRRIARELHDETSQSLAALILALDTVAIAAPPDAPRVEGAAPGLRERLTSTRDLAVRILDGVHELIFDLRPSLLDDLGLSAAIRWFAESRLGAAGVQVSVEISEGEGRLPPEVETALFRALQEAITNVARHAEADSVVVRVEVRPGEVVAEVEDDGRGFDLSSVKVVAGGMRGLGLMGMEERIGLLGGRMEVVSRPGNGTRIRFVVSTRGAVAEESASGRRATT